MAWGGDVALKVKVTRSNWAQQCSSYWIPLFGFINETDDATGEPEDPKTNI